MSRSKGARYERQLVNAFSDNGWFTRRASASGSGTEDESYDVIAARDGRVFVMELKFSSGERVYVEPEKADALRWVAAQFEATPLIVARFSQDTTFYGYNPANCAETPTGKLTVTREMTDTGMVLPPVETTPTQTTE